MFIVFCLLYLLTLFATGYVCWMIYKTRNFHKLNGLVILLFLIYHAVIYYVEHSDIALIITTLTYGFILFEVIYFISKAVVATHHKTKSDNK